MSTSVILFLALCSVVFSYDRALLSKCPGPQPNFLLDKWMGKWYIQYRLVPCTWPASRGFADWTRIFTEDAKGIIDKESWERDGVCAAELLVRFYQNQPNLGRFKVKDALGGMMSGKMVVPATDYKSFSISWTCVKPSADEDSCSDVALVVETRNPVPSSHTLMMVEAILKKLWGLSLTEMTQYQHTNACPQPYHPESPAPIVKKVFKLY